MINHIIDDIYIGSWKDAKNNKKSFDTIITTARHSPWIGDKLFPIRDGKANDNNYDLIVLAIKAITKMKIQHKHKTILVHCKAGKSRSVICIAGYMIKRYGMSTENAIDAIKKIRPKINPHPNLTKLLQRYEING